MASLVTNAIEVNPINWGIQQISTGLQSVTINPIKDIISYAVPWIKAALNRHVYVIAANRPLVEMMGGDEVLESLQEEIAQLANTMKVKGEICAYTSLSAPFSGCRGLFGKVVTFPIEHIRNKNLNYVSQYETLLTDQELDETKWEFTENETRFLLGTAVAELTIFPLLKVVARVAILGLLIALFFSPLSIYCGGAAFAAGLFLYFSIERIVWNRVDRRAHKILTLRFIHAGMSANDAERQATIVAINSLKKIQLQQLHIRSQDPLYEFLINGDGDVRFDYTVPPLKTRISKLAETLKKEPDPLTLRKNRRVKGRSHPPKRHLSGV